TDEFDADICGFGRYMKKHFLTLDEWKEFDWISQYKNCEFNVEVKFSIRRTGLLIGLMISHLS
ncbi:MAG: Ger(x)C family spore germination C-terminal domain-containing protein, partial [Acetivibrionales bacterium]